MKKHEYYRLRARRGWPTELSGFTFLVRNIRKDGKPGAPWHRPIDLSLKRKFYEPHGPTPHNDRQRLDSTRDEHWLRLTKDQYEELIQFLRTKTSREVGISETCFLTEDTVVTPNPTLFELVEVDQIDPHSWEDLRYMEYFIELAHPMSREDEEVLIIRSPHNAATRDKVDDMLHRLIAHSDLPASAAIQKGVDRNDAKRLAEKRLAAIEEERDALMEQLLDEDDEPAGEEPADPGDDTDTE